ncbi:zinc-binding alcohol dehydrogenase family protein [Streptomyces hokutonensis]|uniref:Zinc-binding alcohol dehydrogenase family protein n=1 Tax=Streptomyces hokutonensis TaxID=1306990 RepID=A0ABW6M6D8_9ACTN
MKAVRIHDFDGVLHMDDVPEPVARDGEVVVQVVLAALNPIDEQISRGEYRFVEPPFTLGVEGMGVVLTPGPRQGERVMFFGFYGAARDGAWAERIAVAEADLVPVPEHFSNEEAAGFLLAFTTAAGALEYGGFTPGTTVLVPAVGGAVGNAGVQLARHWGAARVLTTAGSTAKADQARALGYDGTVCVTDLSRISLVEGVTGAGAIDAAEKLVASVSGDDGPPEVDLVVDTVGGPMLADALSLIKAGGTIVSVGSAHGDTATLDLHAMRRRLIRLLGWNFVPLITDPSQAAGTRARILRAAESGQVSPHIAEVHPLDDIDKAVDRLLHGRLFGKVLVRP